MKLALTMLLLALSGGVANAYQSSSYQDTRKLLSEMKDYTIHPQSLAPLFRIGDARISDLVQALDDPDKEVSLNAQRVIRYLGNKAGLKGLTEYYMKPRKEYWSAGPIPIPLLDFDYDLMKANPSGLREDQIYALVLDDSSRAKELLASIARNGTADSLIAQVLAGVKSRNPNKLLAGKTDLAKLVLKNAFFVNKPDKKYASARLIELNGAKDKAVVEVYIGRGPLAEEWWHAVISKHGDGWKFYSITQVAVS